MDLRSRRTRTHPKVLAVLGTQTGCEVYRVKVPFTVLRNKGYTAHWIDQRDMSALKDQIYDVIVLPRLVPQKRMNLDVVRHMQRLGVKFVYEADDDLTNRYRETIPRQDEKLVAQLVKICDAMTVSTPYLKKLYGHPRTYVLPNHVNLHDWLPYIDSREDESLTIGITGSPTHDKDWRQLADPLHRIARKYPFVRFLIGGFLPLYLQGLPRLTAYDGFLPYSQYPCAIRQIDIGLAALDDDPFNLGKSAIKAIEYMASARRIGNRIGGAVVVASKHPVYRRVVNNRGNGMLAEPDTWFDILCELIEDRKLRDKLAIQGHRWVKKNRSTETCSILWMQAYRDICKEA